MICFNTLIILISLSLFVIVVSGCLGLLISFISNYFQ